MADVVKAQKLAAARKRLKEYQQKTQTSKKSSNNDEDNVEPSQKVSMGALSSGNVTPAESMVSSTHSAFESSVAVPAPESTVYTPQADLKTSEARPSSALITNANYFNNALFRSEENNHILTNYFDTLPQNGNTNNTLDAFTQNSAIVENLEVCTNDATNKSLPVEDLNANNQNTMYADPFEVPLNNFTSMNDVPILPSVENLTNSNDELNSSKPTDTKVYSELLLPDRHKSECALDENLHIETSENQNNLFSNTESLRQLSSQLNSLIDTETIQNVTETTELERRNQELAALLDNERQKTEQLNLQLREYMTRITQLESESQQVRNEQDAKLSREVGPLQEQLQYHVQTVGILVGEKTELTMALNQSQVTAKQKTSECEELQGRLKASRHRVAELEKEVNHLKCARDSVDKNEQENNREFERLRLEYNLLKDQVHEAVEESSELREKLNTKVNECMSLQKELQDKNSQLSLTQLKVQQLTNGENVQAESQLENLHQQKISLEQQIAELSHTVKVVSSERDQASLQYQQYVQQLNGQIQSLAEALETKNTENDTLAKREQSLIKHISEMEKHLQQLQIERQNHVPAKNDASIDVKKLEETISNLQTEKLELEEKHREELESKAVLESQLQEKEDLILELETNLERLKDQPDAAKLLAAMESDKVAASRAVEQNKKLKQQLEELHEGFIKMSNSKLELTESLQSEQHQSRELNEKLEQSIAAVEHLHSVIAIKDKELTEIQNSSTELQKQILHQNQLTDRLRHYEAQGSSSDFVQQELQQAKLTLEQLTAENQKLRLQLTNATRNSEKIEAVVSHDKENPEKTNIELLKQVNENGGNVEEDISSVDQSKSEQYFDKERAMVQLEERFKNTMAEVAELTEEKQRLEHLVMQLQSETETIGEYVALYQCQRAMLKEKTLEKDEQLKRLAKDREEMKIKLEELNALVQKLVVEKGIIPKEILHHSLIRNATDLCETHKDAGALKQSMETKEAVVNGGNNDNNNQNFGTAGQIIALLSEIKTSNLVQPGDSIQNFHPCPWCSGQLITV